ncbi:MAG TPA: pseudouridine synthase [Bacillota bacterium]|nr:pseudouridine synthase [Bacillota bacterium]
MRLDKVLAHMGYGSRKDVKELIKKEWVTVNGARVKHGRIHVDPYNDVIMVKQTPVHYRKYIYVMINKPQGIISATTDRREKTIIDLLPPDVQRFNPFPAGRLDKDAEGLVILTNDGEVAHQLTSPKKAVKKTYYVTVDGRITEKDVWQFAQGIILDDGYQTKPGDLTILTSGCISTVELGITEGKFHQVKRMFAAVGKKVIYLKRLQMGDIRLDTTLEPGAFRELTKTERKYCLSLKAKKN